MGGGLGNGYGCCYFHPLLLVGRGCRFEGDEVPGTCSLGRGGRGSASLDALEQHVTALSPLSAAGPRTGMGGFQPCSAAPTLALPDGHSGVRTGSHSSLPGWQGRADTVPADRVRMGAHRRCGANEGWKGARVLSRRCKACAGVCEHTARVCSAIPPAPRRGPGGSVAVQDPPSSAGPPEQSRVPAVGVQCSICSLQMARSSAPRCHPPRRHPPRCHQPALPV